MSSSGDEDAFLQKSIKIRKDEKNQNEIKKKISERNSTACTKQKKETREGNSIWNTNFSVWLKSCLS